MDTGTKNTFDQKLACQVISKETIKNYQFATNEAATKDQDLINYRLQVQGFLCCLANYIADNISQIKNEKTWNDDKNANQKILAQFKEYYKLEERPTWADIEVWLQTYPDPRDKEILLLPVLYAVFKKVCTTQDKTNGVEKNFIYFCEQLGVPTQVYQTINKPASQSQSQSKQLSENSLPLLKIKIDQNSKEPTYEAANLETAQTHNEFYKKEANTTKLLSEIKNNINSSNNPADSIKATVKLPILLEE